MPISTMATFISINASAQASRAAEEAAHVHVMWCKNFMPAFNSQSSTIEQQQSYAECVNLLYPQHQSIPDSFAKTIIVCALMGICIGTYLGKNDKFIGGWDMVIIGSFLGAIVGALIPMFVAGIFCAVKFLIS